MSAIGKRHCGRHREGHALVGRPENDIAGDRRVYQSFGVRAAEPRDGFAGSYLSRVDEVRGLSTRLEREVSEADRFPLDEKLDEPCLVSLHGGSPAAEEYPTATEPEKGDRSLFHTFIDWKKGPVPFFRNRPHARLSLHF